MNNILSSPSPPNHYIEDNTVDIEEINKTTGDEEEREMEVYGLLTCSPDNVRHGIFLEKECTRPCPVWLLYTMGIAG